MTFLSKDEQEKRRSKLIRTIWAYYHRNCRWPYSGSIAIALKITTSEACRRLRNLARDGLITWVAGEIAKPVDADKIIQDQYAKVGNVAASHSLSAAVESPIVVDSLQVNLQINEIKKALEAIRDLFSGAPTLAEAAAKAIQAYGASAPAKPEPKPPQGAIAAPKSAPKSAPKKAAGAKPVKMRMPFGIRIAQTLKALATFGGPATAPELDKRMGTPHGTARSALKPLVKRGDVRQLPDGKFEIVEQKEAPAAPPPAPPSAPSPPPPPPPPVTVVEKPVAPPPELPPEPKPKPKIEAQRPPPKIEPAKPPAPSPKKGRAAFQLKDHAGRTIDSFHDLEEAKAALIADSDSYSIRSTVSGTVMVYRSDLVEEEDEEESDESEESERDDESDDEGEDLEEEVA